MALFPKKPRPHPQQRAPRQHSPLLGHTEYEDGSSEFRTMPPVQRDVTSLRRPRPRIDLSVPLRGQGDFGHGEGEIRMPPSEPSDFLRHHPATKRPVDQRDQSPTLLQLMGLYFKDRG